MDIPTYDALLNPTLTALHELGGSATNDEIVEQVIEDLRLPTEVVEQPHGEDSYQTELEYRLAWSRTYLKKYGLINNSQQGVWALTPQGMETEEVDPEKVVQHYRQLREQKEKKQADDGADAIETDKQLADWHDDLREALLSIPPEGFERLCQRLLRESGFTEVEVTGRSGDGGIDGHGIIRIGGLISFPIIFQAKRHRGSIGSQAIRDFRGAMAGRAQKGLVITTGRFTRDAKQEASRDGAPPIDLIDGERLMDKLKELGLGVETDVVERVEVDDTWFESI